MPFAALLRNTPGAAVPSDIEAEGRAALAAGKVAVLMVAGGISSRWNGFGLRGNAEIGPVSSRSVFQLQGEKVRAVSRRCGRPLRWLVMTSDLVHDATVDSFARQEYFGLRPEDVWFFRQESAPVEDAESMIFRDGRGEPVLFPTGHGGMLAALAQSGYLDRLTTDGVEFLFYFQYPNVLEKVCDPVLIGFHCQCQHEATVKAFEEYGPDEPLGRIVAVGKGLRVVEYLMREQEDKPPWWNTAPANMATYVWNVSFLSRCVRQNVELPWYRLPYHHPAAGGGSLYKRERFIFDLLPHARSAGVVLVDRAEEYAAVKDQASLETARSALLKLYQQWLKRAGAQAARLDCRAEISPLFALDEHELKDKLPGNFTYGDGLVLR